MEGIDNFRHWTSTVADFTRTTGIAVDFDLLPWRLLVERTNEAFQASEAPYDVIAADESSLARYARAGSVLALDEFLDRGDVDLSAYSKAALECVRVNSSVVGVPYSNMANFLFYREDVFQAHDLSVPATLDELASTANQLQEALAASGVSEMYGIVARGKSVAALENVWIFGSSVAPAFGGRWIDADGRCCFHTEQMVEALEYYADMLRRSGPPDVAEMDYTAATAAYFEGRAAMLIEVGCSVVTALAENTSAARNTRTTLIPADRGGDRHPGLWVPAWSIPTAASDSESAWEFIAWASSAPVAETDLLGGHVEQARFSAVTAPAAGETYSADLIDAVATTRAFAHNERPLVDDWFELGDALGDAVEDVVAGRSSAEEALARAEEVVEATTGRGSGSGND